MKLAKKHLLGAAMATLMVSGLAASVTARAAETPYVTDGEGNPVMSDIGGCVHTEAWKKSMPTCPEPTAVLEESKNMIVFAVDDSQFFGFDKVTLSDQAKADLDAVVNAVDDSTLIHGVTVTGHADEIGPAQYNEQLAMRRAEAVKAYLVSKGIPADRIEAISDGSSQPLVTCPGIKNEGKLVKCLAPNRRVDVEALLADEVDIATINLVPATTN